MKCPRCFQGVRHWIQVGDRRKGFCECNPAGPVLNIPATAMDDPLTEILGISKEIAQALRQAGLGSLPELARASDEKLLSVSGIGPARLQQIRSQLEVIEL